MVTRRLPPAPSSWSGGHDLASSARLPWLSSSPNATSGLVPMRAISRFFLANWGATLVTWLARWMGSRSGLAAVLAPGCWERVDMRLMASWSRFSTASTNALILFCIICTLCSRSNSLSILLMSFLTGDSPAAELAGVASSMLLDELRLLSVTMRPGTPPTPTPTSPLTSSSLTWACSPSGMLGSETMTLFRVLLLLLLGGGSVTLTCGAGSCAAAAAAKDSPCCASCWVVMGIGGGGTATGTDTWGWMMTGWSVGCWMGDMMTSDVPVVPGGCSSACLW
mmetsp:Transcript_11722/g.28153  ORF Transcript_11722/g.28153 Transcript_11722/m.28153 type:complete len:280 (+) Transcript_11722:1065-1904(+)